VFKAGHSVGSFLSDMDYCNMDMGLSSFLPSNNCCTDFIHRLSEAVINKPISLKLQTDHLTTASTVNLGLL